jgi:hypothetical protein
LARTTRRTTPASLAWPDWHGTAQQVHDILLGGAWYKTYHPQDVPPNAVPDDIGDMRMLSPEPGGSGLFHALCRWPAVGR